MSSHEDSIDSKEVKVEDPVAVADEQALSQYTFTETKKILRRNLDSNIVSYVKTINTGKSTNILKQLHMTTDQYGYLSTVFTCTFLAFEVPSNLILKWSTPRLHFCRIIFFWSVAACCHAAATNKGGLYAARAFLGVFEAGLFPGILVQMTFWYRPDELAIRMAMINVLGQFSNILDALIAYGLAYIDGRHGLSGWQWAFIIVGCIGFVLTGIIFLFLPDYPDSPQGHRQFLTPQEGKFIVDRLPPTSPRQSDANFNWDDVKAACKDPLLYGFSLIMLCQQTGIAGYTFWLPSIIAGYGFTTTTNAQLLNIPPAAIYIISALGFAWISDHTFKIPRPVYMLVSLVVLIGTFIGLTVCRNNAGLLTLILLTAIPYAIYQTMIYPWRSQSTKGSAYASFAFAFQNSVGQIASIFAAQIFQSKYAPRYTIPYIVCIIFFALALLAVLFTWYFSHDIEKENRRQAKERRLVGKVDNIVVV
ncbi:MFS general substrate transporter [Guyanagaster necrorhizus]|uniref:MFS general substrate transporter n=1 Tax=Guyanagaster necrorhizus TaxID=856835 RepID=A0A9P7VXQ8_9AGAR|nr:MFS general substrate transporter [Guyanagaster necrorhizus MCA 3950]KAG7448395.1 MFS general substrate transporter [Guyanagaster necrorhizus MCA 3950]